MPTPPKTSRTELVSIALRLIETAGADMLTVSAVAEGAGVKGPSIYKHFADRTALLKAVEIDILHGLEAVLRARTKGKAPLERLKSMARAYRAFATERPRHYEVIYSRNAFNDPQITEACLFAAKPLFEELRSAGIAEPLILPLARTLTAFLHGFVSMEIVNAFRFGGDIGEAFEAGLNTILKEI